MLMLRLPELTRTEWQAVVIALRDAERPRPRLNPIARLYRLLTGDRGERPLADRRLEAIRAFMCETRRRGEAPAPLAEALEDQGFTSVQVSALAMIAR